MQWGIINSIEGAINFWLVYNLSDILTARVSSLFCCNFSGVDVFQGLSNYLNEYNDVKDDEIWHQKIIAQSLRENVVEHLRAFKRWAER